jgi:hypothetical protein
MKTKNYAFLLLLAVAIGSTTAQTYTGTAWKAGGWNFGTDNDQNFAAENIIEAWQYDKGACMPLPTVFTTAVADFKAGNYAAGQVLAVTTLPADLTTCATMSTRLVWDAANSTTVANVFRAAYLNKRKGDTTPRLQLLTCPSITAGTTTLDPTDPALYANPAAFVMNDAYGRLGTGGAAARYSITFAPGKYNFLFKGNNTNVQKVRLLKRGVDNVLTEVYSGTASAAATGTFNQKVAPINNADLNFSTATGYEKLNDHMKIYASAACVFSLQNNKSAGAPANTLLELELNGNYVLESITDITGGTAGAYTFKYVGTLTSTGATLAKTNITTVNIQNKNIRIQLNDFGASTVKIYNIAGALVATQNNITAETMLNATHFAKGVYVVKIDNTKSTELHKLVVE